MSGQIYRMEVWQDTKGLDFGRWAGIELSSRKSVTADLARKIVALDAVEDGPIHVHGLDGKLRYVVRSVYAHANRTITETDKASIRFTRWAPDPRFAA